MENIMKSVFCHVWARLSQIGKIIPVCRSAKEKQDSTGSELRLGGIERGKSKGFYYLRVKQGQL
jgi:hypothetical protein